MFTGLIEAQGELLAREQRDGGARLVVLAPRLAAEAVPGESVAVNGCCLTVTAFDPAAGTLQFDLLKQTLDVTNLGALKPGAFVNLERSLQASARLGGHFVSGHIDCCAAVLRWERAGGDWLLEVEVPARYERYVVERGSAAVNGISLTIAALEPGLMRFYIIPHTLQETNLGSLPELSRSSTLTHDARTSSDASGNGNASGDGNISLNADTETDNETTPETAARMNTAPRVINMVPHVNLEFDLLAKYAERAALYAAK